MSSGSTSERVELAGLTGAQLRAEARRRLPRGHGLASRLYREAVGQGRFAPEALEGTSAEAAAAWRSHFALSLPEVVRVAEEPGEHGTTAKAVLRLGDGLEVECVHIPMGRGRHTLCVSSQVGCKMGCRFCETARLGLLRHLRAHEIVGQLLVARHRLGWPVDHVVFQGMGEPLDNVEQVVQALRVMTDPAGLAMGQERFTVCTVGHLEGLRRLRAEGFRRLGLSVSLTMAEPEGRRRLVPATRRWPLEALREELLRYRPRRNFVLGVHYCLMPGINDRREHARQVARFCEGMARVLVHVIPYNPGSEPLTQPPTDEEVVRFVGWLREEGLPVRRRITKGRSVMAACGQLGNPRLRRRLGHPWG